MVAGMDQRTILPNSPEFGGLHTRREMVVFSLSLLLLFGAATIFSANSSARAGNDSDPPPTAHLIPCAKKWGRSVKTPNVVKQAI